MQTDINDLGYIYFSVGINNARYMNRDIDNRFSDSVFLGICIYILRFIYYFVKSPWRYNTSLKKEKAVLIYGESTNNRNTLLPIIKELGDNKVIDLFSHSQYPHYKFIKITIESIFEILKAIKAQTPYPMYAIAIPITPDNGVAKILLKNIVLNIIFR